jgi:hypothetical protein
MPLTPLRRNRFNPFSEDLVATNVRSEYHTIPSSPPHYVELHEVPVEEIPSNVKVLGFEESYSAPTSGYFQVDYTYHTGKIRFHSDNAAQAISVSYRGAGSVISAGKFNAILNQVPEDGFIEGCCHDDWVGTHFTWSGTSSAISSRTLGGWEARWHNDESPDNPLKLYFADGRCIINRGSTALTSYGHVSLYNRHSTYDIRTNVTMAMQLAFCMGSSFGSGSSFFSYFAAGINGETGGFPPSSLTIIPAHAPYSFDATWLTTTDANSETYDVMSHFPAWSCLPVGFGKTKTGSFYFCTFGRSTAADWHSVINVLDGVGNSDTLPTTPAELTGASTLGGHITDISNHFNRGWQNEFYDIRIELNPSMARIFVDGRLAAVHNTWIPTSFYTSMMPFISASYDQLNAGVEGNAFSVDYFSCGPLDPVSPSVGQTLYF